MSCRKMLENAFANRPYPGDHKIGIENDDEGHQVADFFKGKDWRQLTLEALLHEYSGDATATISFMAPEGFRYYLPAFLSMSLDPDSEIVDSVMFNLTPPDPHKTDFLDWFRSRVEGLSPDERAAVIYTLRYLSERYDREEYPFNPAREALERYWDPQ